MKKLPILLLSITLLLIISCNKNEDPPSVPQELENLIANDDFDWETSKKIRFEIYTDYSGVISITSENGDVLYIKGYYNGKDPSYIVDVTLPKYTDKVLINNKLVEISGEIIEVALDANTPPNNGPMNKNLTIEDRVAYWQFNENTGNVAFDSEGNNDGIITGADWKTGINGSALDFDGVGGHVEVPLTDELNFLGENASFSVWFKMNEVGDDGTLLFNRMKYIMKYDKFGRISLNLYNPTWVAVTMDWGDRILDTDWHNAIVTYNGSYLKLYLDTELLATTQTSGEINSSTSDIFIGNQDTENDYPALIDQVAIYTSTLSVQEIIDIYENTPNPGSGNQDFISHWKLNENSGTTATDSESTNNGSITGAQWVAGVEGGALEFNGGNSNVNIPNAPNLNTTESITIMSWAKVYEYKESKIAQKGDWDGHGIGIGKWNGWKGHIRIQGGETESIEWDDGRPALDVWNHLAMTYDGDYLKLYINGQLCKSRAVTGELNQNDRTFSIGSDNGNQKFFNGSIDDVRIYGSALSQTEIQFIFNNPNNTGNTDSDGDGIQDIEDDYPNDPARAFNNYLPAAGFGCLAFEDLWPGIGDFDFNDLVLDYRFTTITNAQNMVVEIVGSFVVRAIGAGLKNGFGFQFPNNNIDATDVMVTGYNIDDGYISLADNGIENGQNKPTIIVFDNANNILHGSNGFGVNVSPGFLYIEPDTISISIVLTPNVFVIEDIDLINFNPFLIIDRTRSTEIHLADYPPTNLADTELFGTGDDDSDPATGKYYKTISNLPWAIKIAESFDYCIERAEITSAHLKFYDWAAASGSLYPNWYQNETGYRDEANIYEVP